jgi:hypothetical protein
MRPCGSTCPSSCFSGCVLGIKGKLPYVFFGGSEVPQPLMRPTQTHIGPSARAPTDRGTWGFGKGVVSSDFAVEVGHCARRAPPRHLGGRPEHGSCLRCMRTCREIRNRPSDRAPERTSPCRITYTRGRAPFSGPRVARRNLRMCFRLIRAVSTRLAHQSCIDLAFCVCPTVLAPPGLAMRARRERWSDQIESRERGAVPAG